MLWNNNTNCASIDPFLSNGSDSGTYSYFVPQSLKDALALSITANL